MRGKTVPQHVRGDLARNARAGHDIDHGVYVLIGRGCLLRQAGQASRANADALRFELLAQRAEPEPLTVPAAGGWTLAQRLLDRPEPWVLACRLLHNLTLPISRLLLIWIC